MPDAVNGLSTSPCGKTERQTDRKGFVHQYDIKIGINKYFRNTVKLIVILLSTKVTVVLAYFILMLILHINTSLKGVLKVKIYKT